MESTLKQRADGFWEIEGTRADLVYSPKVKQLVDCMCLPDLKTKDGRELLIKILDNKIKNEQSSRKI